MVEIIRPVRHGILIGLLGIIFGVVWAFWLALGHEVIVNKLDATMKQDVVQKEEVIKVSFKRLGMGHSHSMGLGLVAIAVSFILAFTTASNKLKAAGSLLSGLGGIIFPVAWIIMGCKTPVLGIDGAHAAVTPLAGIGVILILSGLFIALGCLIRDALK
ncbi:MAG: hypothetical protein Q7T53_00095 [Deltaproteobacteria bacterium]|nr:hypothetical protein [Deltaproteobacteria bacterium]